MDKIKTLKDLRIEEELCEKLDTEVYLPVKEELKGIGITYSLGIRKENFKVIIDQKFRELKKEAINHIKFLDNENNLQFFGVSKSARYGMQYWIKHFFNITEEDL